MPGSAADAAGEPGRGVRYSNLFYFFSLFPSTVACAGLLSACGLREERRPSLAYAYVRKGYTVCTEGVYNRSALLYIDIYIYRDRDIYIWVGWE